MKPRFLSEIPPFYPAMTQDASAVKPAQLLVNQRGGMPITEKPRPIGPKVTGHIPKPRPVLPRTVRGKAR